MRKAITVITLCLFIAAEVGVSYLITNISTVALKGDVFTFQCGSEITDDVSFYMSGNDYMYGNATLDLSKVDNKVGTYTATISYDDKEYSFTIEVVDTIKPKGTLIQSEWSVLVDEKLKAEDLFESIDDVSKTTAYFEATDKHDQSKSISFSESGSSIEKVFLEDEYGNQSSSYRVIVNVNETANEPVIEGADDAIIKQGDAFNVLQGVTATDDRDGDLTDKITVIGAIGDKPGDYTLVYSVTNTRGLTTTIKRTISVE